MFVKKEGKWGIKRFTMLDVFFHIGVGINLVIIALLIWYSIS